MLITQDLQDLYKDQYSNKKMQQWREIGAIQKAKNIVDITKNIHFQNILEVGAGDGAILAQLSKQNFAIAYTAVEISESGIQAIQARKLAKLKQVLKFDGYKLPFADKSFDLVILSHVLEHVEHERVLLRELKRVAKYAVIEVPREYRFGVQHRLQHFLNYGHINMYTPSSFAFLLGTEGFYIHKTLCRLYGLPTYLYQQKTFLGRLKAYTVYLAKALFSAVPLKSFNQKYINTITVLLKD